MLTAIIVERLGVIERAEVEIGGGSVVLTGETGAGKTLVVSAASLLLGARADRALVRTGSEDALVQGRFVVRVDHPAVAILRSHGIRVAPSEEEAELIVARSLSVEPKRNRVRINGSLVPLATLAEVGPLLIEIAGQNEHSKVTSSSHQRALLDSYAGASGLAARVAEAVGHARNARSQAETLAAEERDREREIESLQREVGEIDRIAPRRGELEEVETTARRLERAADLVEGSRRISSLLRGEGGTEETLAEASRVLEDLSHHAPELTPLAERLAGAGVEVGDVATEMAGLFRDADPAALDEIQGRIAALRSLRRKYGDDERVLSHAAWARTRIEELEGVEETAERLRREAVAGSKAADALAAELTERRFSAAPSLSREIEDRLGMLALSGTRFSVTLEPSALYEGGSETVAFEVAPNPGEEPSPLRKVASGGELSRIALALNLITTAKTTGTVIFDEVDAGVGGAAAAEVGRSLARLADDGIQVIVVTHLPQVAAFASEHHVVSKEIEGDRARAMVRKVEGEERVAEVTRMLAGLPDSRLGREHARELLELASRGLPAA